MTEHCTANDDKRGFLRLPQVLEILPISKSSWWAGVRAGKFPKPIRLTPRTSAWSRSSIDSLCDQLAGKDGRATDKEDSRRTSGD